MTKKNSPLTRSVNIYFGPGIPGVVSRFEVFTGKPSGRLKKMFEEHPLMSELCCTTDEYGEKQIELSDKESGLNVIYKKVEKEINGR